MGYDWTKLLALAGGAAATAALVYYLLQDEPAGGSAAGGAKPGEMDKKELLKLLNEIVASQSDMSNLMKEITDVVLKENLTFEQVYQRVKARQPRDPLEKRGLSIQDFDAMLDTHQNDDEVKKVITEIMTAGNVKQGASSPVPIADIIQVHEFMCKELQQIVDEYKKLDNKDSYEKKTLTIAAQAIVASRVQKTYNYTSEQIEACVLANHEKLSQDAKFTTLSIQMQQTMGQLIG
jgi:hypothetical protein